MGRRLLSAAPHPCLSLKDSGHPSLFSSVLLAHFSFGLKSQPLLKCKWPYKYMDNKGGRRMGWTGRLGLTYICVLVISCFSRIWLSATPMDCSPWGSSVHGILQVRILEWVTIPFSRESSWPRDWTVSLMSPALAGRFFTTRASWEALWHISTTTYKIDNWWEPTVQLRELYSVLCGDLNGKEIQKWWEICIHVADLLCCTVETNNIVKQLYSNKKNFFNANDPKRDTTFYFTHHWAWAVLVAQEGKRCTIRDAHPKEPWPFFSLLQSLPASWGWKRRWGDTRVGGRRRCCGGLHSLQDTCVQDSPPISGMLP